MPSAVQRAAMHAGRLALGKKALRWDLQEKVYLALLQSRARVAGRNRENGSLHLSYRRRHPPPLATRKSDWRRVDCKALLRIFGQMRVVACCSKAIADGS